MKNDRRRPKGRNRSSAAPAKREWSDTKDYQDHPLAKRFPLIEGDEFENLADDIAVSGQKETVKVYEGKILDGRNRYRACKARRIPCRFQNWDGKGDPWDFVLSMNLHRRHLTSEARQALVVELRKEGRSIRQIAETIQTSVGTVHRALEKATVPNGTVEDQALPNKIKGKDGKERQARKPDRANNGSKRKGEGKTADAPMRPDASAKGERPTKGEMIQIISRGLDKTGEVESIKTGKTSMSFQFHGYTVSVACKITG